MDFSKYMAKIKKMDKNTILVGIAIIAIIVTGGLLAAKSSGFDFSGISLFGMSDKQLADKAIKYINDSGLSNSTASLVSVSSESGLAKVRIKIGGNEFDSYVTRDGKLLFPQAFKMEDAKGSNKGNDTAGSGSEQKKYTCDTLPKQDKAMVQAFIVSRCPFGLQMQRVMAEAIRQAPELAKYVKVLYMGSVSGNKLTSMHGDAEATENLRQICIREEQPDKYWPYVSCQMKKGDTAGCEKSTWVDSGKLSGCVNDAKRGAAYAQKDFDLSSKYNVSGSPTLVMADQTVSEFDFGGRNADAMKQLVCCGSNSKPGFCSQTFNKKDAATSFSETYESASGGSGSNSGGGCAPAQ